MVYIMLISIIIFTTGFFFAVKLFMKYENRTKGDISGRNENGAWQ